MRIWIVEDEEVLLAGKADQLPCARPQRALVDASRSVIELGAVAFGPAGALPFDDASNAKQRMRRN